MKLGWHDGRYSHQAEALGYTRIAPGVVAKGLTDGVAADLERRIEAAVARETEDIRRGWAGEVIMALRDTITALEDRVGDLEAEIADAAD